MAAVLVLFAILPVISSIPRGYVGSSYTPPQPYLGPTQPTPITSTPPLPEALIGDPSGQQPNKDGSTQLPPIVSLPMQQPNLDETTHLPPILSLPTKQPNLDGTSQLPPIPSLPTKQPNLDGTTRLPPIPSLSPIPEAITGGDLTAPEPYHDGATQLPPIPSIPTLLGIPGGNSSAQQSNLNGTTPNAQLPPIPSLSPILKATTGEDFAAPQPYPVPAPELPPVPSLQPPLPEAPPSNEQAEGSYRSSLPSDNGGHYGISTKPVCHTIERVEWVDQCEQFMEKTCFTQNKEQCEQELYKNCTGTIKTNVERVCFDVVENLCSLAEHVNYDMVEETYMVTKCTKVKDRVCDTVFDIRMVTRDDYLCLDLESPSCYLEDTLINDVVCKHSVEFNCKKVAAPHLFASKEDVCHQNPTSRCYDVPRTIHVEKCNQEVHKFCEKFSNKLPLPVERQNCHFETKRICEVQHRVRPKKAKRFSYSMDCMPINREVCDSKEMMILVPTCENVVRLKCGYVPEIQCNEEPREYCHKVEKVIVEEVCQNKFDTSYL